MCISSNSLPIQSIRLYVHILLRDEFYPMKNSKSTREFYWIECTYLQCEFFIFKCYSLGWKLFWNVETNTHTTTWSISHQNISVENCLFGSSGMMFKLINKSMKAGFSAINSIWFGSLQFFSLVVNAIQNK